MRRFLKVLNPWYRRRVAMARWLRGYRQIQRAILQAERALGAERNAIERMQLRTLIWRLETLATRWRWSKP